MSIENKTLSINFDFEMDEFTFKIFEEICLSNGITPLDDVLAFIDSQVNRYLFEQSCGICFDDGKE